MDRNTANDFIERLIPPMALLMTMQGLAAEGLRVGSDTAVPLKQAVQVIVKRMPENEREKMVRDAFTKVEAILGPENGGSKRQTVLATCMFICKLVDEGIKIDPGSQAVLVSLLVLEEAKQDPEAGWGYHRPTLEEAGGRVLSRARLLGLFSDGVKIIH